MAAREKLIKTLRKLQTTTNMAAPMDKLFVREFEAKNGNVLEISQCEVGDVGCVVWDAALVLSYFLETPYFLELCGGDVKGLTGLELGAGTGIVGIQAGTLGLNVTITDLPEFVLLIDHNIKANQKHIKGDVTAAELTWGADIDSSLSNPDIIFLADCIYYDASLEPLVQTLDKLTDKHSIVFCCYEERTTDNKPRIQKRFFQLIGEKFDVQNVPLEKQDPLFHSEDIHIMIFKKR